VFLKFLHHKAKFTNICPKHHEYSQIVETYLKPTFLQDHLTPIKAHKVQRLTVSLYSLVSFRKLFSFKSFQAQQMVITKFSSTENKLQKKTVALNYNKLILKHF
jgi:hypothetical protein